MPKKWLIAILFIVCARPSFLQAVITANPPQPNLEQVVTLTVSHPDGVSENRARWDFGDGTPVAWDSATVTHIYRQTGTFIIKASYWPRTGGSQLTDQLTLTVSEKRRITYSPPKPVVNQTVTFRAENFLSTNIRWDFGDGNPATNGGAVESHAYAREGTYTVTAKDWFGDSLAAITTSLTVEKIPVGPGASFQISYIQIRFADGSNYQVVAKNFKPFRAFADIKYEGTGTLQGAWLVDGQPIVPFTDFLSYAQSTTIDSGDVPGLPTLAAGTHEVSLRIDTPPTDLLIPVIRYRVESGEAPASLSISGDVLFADTRKPVKEATVEYRAVASANSQKSSEGRAAVTDALGKFSIDAVPPNSQFSLEVYGSGFEAAEKSGSIGTSNISDFTILVQPTSVQTPALTLTTPKGGEEWEEGTEHEITWTSSGFSASDQLKIELFIDQGQSGFFEVASGVSAQSGKYRWAVGLLADKLPISPGGKYKIRISSPAATDTSDGFFSILPSSIQPKLTLLKPNGGEELVRGTWAEIAWSSADFPQGSTISINLYKGDQFLGPIYIYNPIPMKDGKYQWKAGEMLYSSTVPVEGDDYKIRVWGRFYSKVIEDWSDGYFKYRLPKLSVTSPRTGDIWQEGQCYDIAWEAPYLPGNVYIYLYKKNHEVGLIARDVPAADGKFRWCVGDALADGKTYVSGSDYSILIDGDGADAYSKGFFEINREQPTPALTLTAPKGGEEWFTGQTYKVSWQNQGASGMVDLFLYKGDVEIQNIAPSQPPQGEYEWQIPAEATCPDGSDYRIKIQSQNQPEIQDWSDSAFSIKTYVLPSITVISPNGGEKISPGFKQTIGWNASGHTGPLAINLWKGGQFYQIIASVPAASPQGGEASWDWVVPKELPIGADYRIEIAASDNSQIHDTSDAEFAVVLPGLVFLSPRGGEEIELGSTLDVSWNTEGMSGTMELRLLYTNGNKVGIIAKDVPLSQGTYNWPVGSLLDGSLNAYCWYQLEARTSESNLYWRSKSFIIQSASFAPSLKIIGPGNSETLAYKANRYIFWEAKGICGDANLLLMRNGQKMGSIYHGMSLHNGNCPWVVGQCEMGQYENSFAPSGGGYSIAIESVGLKASAQGSEFTISSLAELQNVTPKEVYPGGAVTLSFRSAGGTSLPEKAVYLYPIGQPNKMIRIDRFLNEGGNFFVFKIPIQTNSGDYLLYLAGSNEMPLKVLPPPISFENVVYGEILKCSEPALIISADVRNQGPDLPADATQKINLTLTDPARNKNLLSRQIPQDFDLKSGDVNPIQFVINFIEFADVDDLKMANNLTLSLNHSNKYFFQGTRSIQVECHQQLGRLSIVSLTPNEYFLVQGDDPVKIKWEIINGWVPGPFTLNLTNEDGAMKRYIPLLSNIQESGEYELVIPYFDVPAYIAHWNFYVESKKADRRAYAGHFKILVPDRKNDYYIFARITDEALEMGKTYQIGFYLSNSSHIRNGGEARVFLEKSRNNSSWTEESDFVELSVSPDGGSGKGYHFSLTLPANLDIKNYPYWRLDAFSKKFSDVVGFSSWFFLAPTGGYFTILSPQANDVFHIGDMVDIQWKTNYENQSHVAIDLLTYQQGLTFVARIADDIPDSGQFSWQISKEQLSPYGSVSSYMIEVHSVSGGHMRAISEKFIIQ